MGHPRRSHTLRNHRAHSFALAVAVALCASVLCEVTLRSQSALSAPAEPRAAAVAELEAAKQEVLELESKIEAWSEERIAIEERLRAVNLRIFAQQDVLLRAEADVRSARAAVADRVIRLYKNSTDPWTILLASESVGDLYNRLRVLARVTEQDMKALREARLAATEASYQASVLDELKSQEIALRDLHADDMAKLTEALARQEQLVKKLDDEARAYLAARRAAVVRTRAEWRESSIPSGTAIRFVPAVVEPYGDRTFLVSEHQPRRYRTTGRSFSAFCSWYGNEFHGRPTASGQIYNQNDFTSASRTLPFGTRLALTRGDRRIIVVITDRGPFIPGRDLDLSRAAATALGFSGLATVHAEFVEVVGAP